MTHNAARKAGYKVGTDFEKKFVEKYGGELVTDKALQYKDIDVILPDGTTVSVKNQTKGSGKSGNISLELRQFNTKSGKDTPGNFVLCEADLLAIAVTYCDEQQWLLLDKKDFNSWIDKWVDIDKGWLKKTLTPWTIEINRKENRFFDNAENLLIPIHVVAKRFRGSLEFLE